MTEWWNLTKDEQVAALQQVAGQKHIPPQAAEKDLWVTVILQVVFSLSFCGEAGVQRRYEPEQGVRKDRTILGRHRLGN